MPELSPELKAFLIRYFDSVESLEIVALLERSSTAYWTRQAISQQLGIPEDVIDTKLGALTDAKILVCGEQTGAYRFAPASHELRDNVAEVLRVYGEQRASVITAIYTGSLEQLRAFSDAFRLKKDS